MAHLFYGISPFDPFLFSKVPFEVRDHLADDLNVLLWNYAAEGENSVVAVDFEQTFRVVFRDFPENNRIRLQNRELVKQFAETHSETLATLELEKRHIFFTTQPRN